MKIDEFFPTKYLKANEIPDKGGMVTIETVVFEDMEATSFAPAATKPVLYLREFKKGIVLSRALATSIAEILGQQETISWIGKHIYIYATLIDSGRGPHLAIRARTPSDPIALKNLGVSVAYKMTHTQTDNDSP
jgi:hypothetical protein